MKIKQSSFNIWSNICFYHFEVLYTYTGKDFALYPKQAFDFAIETYYLKKKSKIFRLAQNTQDNV